MSVECEHKWVYIDSVKSSGVGAFQIHWVKISRFFCEKCLELKQVKQEEWSRDCPAWW